MSATRSSARPQFECRYRARVPALDGELTQYVHAPTGARHFHLDAPLDDNAFLMAFRTPAPDSSGLTHILEHMVLCGSERYPCRRAFFAMLGRTLSTTMNAGTTVDHTTYHFATRNLSDYENLLSVYVDAAFFPRLDRLDFEQEGCRVEIDAGNGEGNAPERRGVVLSEMRGVMSEPERQLEQALNRSLFSGAPYWFNAGGDPRAILALEYGTLKAYHRRHYRPANAIFLSSGPLRPEWLHDRLRDLALDRLSCRRPESGPGSGPPELPPLRAPARSVVHYPANCAGDSEPAGAGVALGWRLGKTSEPIEAVRAQFLAACLLADGDGPLHRALLEASGSPAVAFASNAVQAMRPRLALRCGAHGCDPDLAGKIEARVMAAVDGVAHHGLDPAHVDGALARIEREQRERHDPRFPFPLKLLTRILPVALYGGDPVAALDIPAALAALRNETRSPRDVAALVRRCLRDNPERATVTAIPDPAAARRLDAEDRAALERAYGPSRRQARRRLVERSRALRRRQESASGESSLPRVGLGRIGPPRERPELVTLPIGGPLSPTRHRQEGTETAGTGPSAESRSGGPARTNFDAAVAVEASRPAEAAPPRVMLSRGPTGGLVYARLAVDIPGLGIEELDDVGVLAEVLPESGHCSLGPDETRARIARYCDRVAVEPWTLARVAPAADGSGAAAPRAVLLFSARARAADEDMLVQIVADAHLRRPIRRRRPGRRGKGPCASPARPPPQRPSPCRARRRGAARPVGGGSGALARPERARDSGSGGGGRERRRAARRTSAPGPPRARRRAVPAPDRPRPRHPVERGTGSRLGRVCRRNAGTGHPCRAGRTGPDAWNRARGPRASGPHPRRAVSRFRHRRLDRGRAGQLLREGLPAVVANHPDAGPLAVLAAFLGGDLLQRAVRERGGAYGAGARYCARTCTVRMFSYRDPRLAGTLHDFDGALESLCRHPPQGRSLEEAVLRAVREIDRPKAFQVDALERYLDELQGSGPEGSLSLRASVLGAEPGRLRDVAQRYLTSDRGCDGVLAGAGREAELDRLGLPWRRL